MSSYISLSAISCDSTTGVYNFKQLCRSYRLELHSNVGICSDNGMCRAAVYYYLLYFAVFLSYFTQSVIYYIYNVYCLQFVYVTLEIKYLSIYLSICGHSREVSLNLGCARLVILLVVWRICTVKPV
jgi:hypothetical protein